MSRSGLCSLVCDVTDTVNGRIRCRGGTLDGWQGPVCEQLARRTYECWQGAVGVGFKKPSDIECRARGLFEHLNKEVTEIVGICHKNTFLKVARDGCATQCKD